MARRFAPDTGRTLHGVATQRGLTLRGLATRSGVQYHRLSRIARGITDPEAGEVGALVAAIFAAEPTMETPGLDPEERRVGRRAGPTG